MNAPEKLRRLIRERAAHAAAFISGASFDEFCGNAMKRSACEMTVIASGTALARLLVDGQVPDEPPIKRLIALAAELQKDMADRTSPAKTWDAVRHDLPYAARRLA